MPVPRKILLNPGPATTTDSVKMAQVVPDICPREQEFCDVIQRIRASLVRVVAGETTHEAVLIAGSGTSSLDACLSSVLPDDAGIAVVNNGAYGQRMLDICRVYYRPDQVHEIRTSDLERPDLGEIDRMLARHPSVTHLACVHHETTTGLLNPIEEIHDVCRRRGVALVIDAVSSFAGIPIDLQRTPYDYLISTANKCVQGMAGIGFVIARRDRLESIASLKPRNYSLSLYQQYESVRTTGQMRFTPPVQVVYALEQALKEYFDEGGEARWARYTDSWRCLIEGLRAAGLTPLLPLHLHSRLLTSIAEPAIPGFDYGRLHDRLYQRHITIYPGKGGGLPNFRVANIGAIDRRDISLFLTYLDEYLTELRGAPAARSAQ